MTASWISYVTKIWERDMTSTSSISEASSRSRATVLPRDCRNDCNTHTTTTTTTTTSGVFRGALCEAPPLWPDRRDFFKDELSRLRTAKVAKVTRSVLFSLKCTRNHLALAELEHSPRPTSRVRGMGPREGRGRDGRWVGDVWGKIREF